MYEYEYTVSECLICIHTQAPPPTTHAPEEFEFCVQASVGWAPVLDTKPVVHASSVTPPSTLTGVVGTVLLGCGALADEQ